ncbi:hypothetical protein AAC387_Pa05g0961 [Persea americana]
MTKLTTTGHRLTNGDSLCSFLRDLGRPNSSSPAFTRFKYRKDSKSAISGLPAASTLLSSSDTSTSSVEKSSKISISSSSRDPLFHQIKESSQSKDRSASDAPTCQEKTDVLRLLARSYDLDSDSPKSSSATYPSLPSSPCSVPTTVLSAFRDSVICPSLPSSPCSVPTTVLSAFRDSVIFPSRQSSNEYLLSISKKTNSTSSPCPHRHSALVDRSYLPESLNSWLPKKSEPVVRP